MDRDIINAIVDTIASDDYEKPTRILIQDKNREANLYKLFDKDIKNIEKVIDLIISIQPAYMKHQIGLRKEIALPNLGTFRPRINSKLIKLKMEELREANVPTESYSVILKDYAHKLRLSRDKETINRNVTANIKNIVNK